MRVGTLLGKVTKVVVTVEVAVARSVISSVTGIPAIVVE